MIQHSKQSDERREAGTVECWCLHGAVGMASDWRTFAQQLADAQLGSRAVDLWRFLECQPLPINTFGQALNTDTGEHAARGKQRALIGYSMGGRLALHALLEKNHPWHAAVIISAHPGLEHAQDRDARTARDAEWASKALMGNWQNLLDDWEAQPVLKGAPIRDARESSRLQMRRREIARSFIDWSLGAQSPLWDRLHEIQTPILWVVGDQDPTFLEIAQRATRILPHARLAITPGAGHRVPWDAPEWLAHEVRHFLQSGTRGEKAIP